MSGRGVGETLNTDPVIPEQAHRRLLLIEDDDVDAMWFQRALKANRHTTYELTRAGTLREGLELLAKTPKPDVVVCDLGLPDTFQLQSFQAVTKSCPELPVIVLTGNISDEDLGIEAVKQGAQDYLVKGIVSPDGLLRAIEYAIERKRTLLQKEHFVYLVSHELQNPLAALTQTVALLVDGGAGELPAKAKMVLNLSLSAINRLSHCQVSTGNFEVGGWKGTAARHSL